MRDPTQPGLDWTVEAELKIDLATIRILDTHVTHVNEATNCYENCYRLDFCLDHRVPGMEVSYPDYWPDRRFERAGEMFLVPPRQKVCLRSNLGHQRTCVSYIAADRLHALLDADVLWTHSRAKASVDIASPLVKGLLMRLTEELCHPGFASTLILEGLTLQIVAQIFRYLDGCDDHISGGLAPWRLKLIEDRIAGEDMVPSLGELANICGLSIRHLSRGFRHDKGVSIGEYLASKRLEKAKHLLACGHDIKTVAHQMGFNHVSSFGVAFKRLMGVSPGQFQKGHMV